jgi:outer membrane protein assembly factor BamE (lipoprotein component of BamABCDE complex)
MRQLIAALFAALVLASCAANPFNADRLPLGATRQEVLERLGRPTRSVPLASGERLQYSLQPYGQAAWMVDLDAAGKVTRVRQVLNTLDFNRIVPGQWTADDVQREFGPPAAVERVSSWKGDILTYRWRDIDRSDMFYWIYLDGRNVVQRAHPGMEFINAPADRE